MAQFNVNLAFNADTGKAKTQIQELQSLLSKIAYTGTASGTDKLENDLHQAAAAAKELQFHLNNAFNASTGNFDLSMLDRSLKTSGANVTDLSMKLLSAGVTGQQAFVKLAQSISLADQPMFRISKRMQEFAVTMKNTVKWQLSSSMLHGFMGAVQSAYGYAQDLNKSLNDIRIVTGYNTDRMAEFAEQANKAAKALSTTTTDYTNASLIYFQQGLSDEEVTARTDITVKMANAVGQSAEVISEQLTAVWNNFADGSKSLEYYADVMAALGAATASSSDEIAEGLSKFSAVASTVGLSYEYATAALATLTSNTRESADVVGNALKTLFARIQGLTLGETLDDGTDLNKYSQALEKVGISIYDANGGLKDMDNILDEMAAKWNTLSDTQQVALAQTVAGVRQYNQLIALMNNWNNSDNDSMMANLRTIEGSEGALQKQADIYAQSWEAAEKKVKAAAEGIYQSLLDDKFFIKLTNGFANVLGGFDAFIEGAGGLKSILVGIGGIVMSTFANRIPEALKTFKYNLDLVTKGSGEVYQKMQKELRDASDIAFSTQYNWSDKQKQFKATLGIDKNSSQGYAIEQANELTSARNKLAVVTDKMTNSERQAAESTIKEIESEQQAIIALKEKNEALQKSINLQKNKSTSKDAQSASRKEFRNLGDLQTDILMDMEEYSRTMAQIEEQIKNSEPVTPEQYEQYDLAENLIPQYKRLSEVVTEFRGNFQDVAVSMQEMQNTHGRSMLDAFLGPDFDQKKEEVLQFPSAFNAAFSNIKDQVMGDNALDLSESINVDAVHREIASLASSIDPVIQEVTGLDKAFEQALQANNAEDMVKAITKLDGKLQDCKIESADFEKVLRKLYGSKNIDQLVADVDKLDLGLGEATSRAAALAKKLQEFNPQHVVRISEAFGALGGFAGSAASIITSLSSTIQSLSNPDLSGWEKFTAVLSSVGMIIPSLMSSISSYATMVSFLNTELAAQQAIEATATIAKAGLVAANFTLAEATEELTEENTANTLSIIANELAEKGNIATSAAATIVKTAYNRVKASGTAITAKAIIANILENATIDQSNRKLSLKAVLLTIIKALTGDWASIVKVLAGALVVLVGISVAKWLDNIIVTQKEAKQAMQEAADAVDEEKSKLQELESELSSVKDKIEELTSKGPLTLTEQAELNRLKTTEQSLSNQIAAQEKLLELERQRQALTITENWGSAYGRLNSGNNTTKASGQYEMKDYGGASGWELLTKWEYWLDAFANGAMAVNGGIITNANNAMMTPVMVEQTEEDYDEWYKKHGAEYLQAENDYITVMQAYTEGLIDLTAEEIAAMQQGIRGGRWASVGGNEDAYFDKYIASHLGNADWSKLTSTDVQNGSFDYASIFGADNLALAGIDATEFNTMINQQMAKAIELRFDPEQIAALNPEQLEVFLTNISNLDAEAKVRFDSLGITIAEWIDGTVNGVYQGFNPTKWKQRYSEVTEIIEGLNIGDTISAADYALLGEEYQQYFTVQADGTAILTTKAEELKAIVQSIEMDKLIGGIESTQDRLDDFQYNTNSEGKLVQDDRYISTTGAKGALDSHNAGWTYRDQDLIDYTSLVNEQYGTSFDTNTVGGWEQAISYMEQQNALLEEQQVLLAGSATSQDQLNQYLQQGLITQEQYNQSLTRATIKEAGTLDIDIENLMEYAKYLQEVEGMSEELALKAALAQKKQGKAVDDLVDNYKDYAKVLKKAKLDSTIKGTEEYSKAIMGLRKDLSLLTGLSEDTFDEDFINSPEVQKALQDVANGVDGAIERIQALAAMVILKDRQQFIIKAGFEVDQEQFSTLTNQIAELNNTDIEIGTRINDAPALDQLANLVNASGMTASQMQEFFNALGWEPEIEWVKADADTVANMSSLGYQEYGVLNPDGSMSIHSVPLDGNMSQHSGQTIMIPKIKTAGKDGKGGGGYTKIDPPGGDGSKSPSGGGGGSKKHAEKKDSGDRTRYHTIQNQLEDLSAAYDEVSEAADRAFGLNKLDLIDKQAEALDNLIDKQKDYVDALAKDVPIDKAVMDAYYDNLINGPAMEFDENGNIANYDDIEAAMHAKYNEMADKYTDDSEEWKAFEKQYEQMEKYIEDYEQYYDDLRDAEAEYQDLLNQRLDLQLEKVQYGVELKLNISQDDLNIIEYQFDLLEDKAFASAERITTATNKANNLYEQMLKNRDALEETLGLSLSDAEIAQMMAGDMSIFDGKTFTESQINAIRDYRDNLLDLNTELIDIQRQIEEEVMAAFEEWHEELDRGIERFDHYGSMLEGYQNIIDIVGKDILGLDNQAIADLSQAQVENSINQLESLREAYESYQASADEALQKYQEAQANTQKARDNGNEELAASYEEDAKFWEDTYTGMNQSAQEAQEAMMDGWGNTLEAIASQFEAAVERAVESFNNAIYQLGGLKGLSEDFSRQKELADMYLDDYQQIYELSKLSRDINNSIDDTENLGGKQKLKKLLEEINKLQEDGVEMSQYDLEYLQKTYDLRMAEIELEEAQKAKDTVRLSRDNEGNWSYVYTQNTDAVDAAQQKYEDALYAMQDLSSNYIDEMSEKLISTSQEMAEAIAAVRVEDYANIEDYYAEIARIETSYQEQLNAQEAELQKAIDNNKVLYEQDWMNYSTATGYKITEAENFAQAFSDTLLGSLVGSEEATANFTNIVGAATDALVQGLADAAANYYTNLNSAMTAAGTSTSEFADLLAEDIEAIKADSAEAADAVAEMAEKMDEEMTKITERVQKWQEDYGREVDKIINKNLEIIESFNAMLETLSVDPDQINVTYDIASNPDSVNIPNDTVEAATGMYTGKWGDEGKVAVLHEKELVLNQNDTSNMLQMLELTRYMLSIIDANAQQLSMGIGSLQATTVGGQTNEVLEQQVSIVAEFPNATDHNEIEEAFNDLINRAAQYAHRK